MNAQTATRVVKSSELREGMVVLTHGARVLLGKVNTRPYTQSERDGDAVTWSVGTVLNLDDDSVNDTLRRFAVADGGTWNVQGNDLARWVVEVDEA